MNDKEKKELRKRIITSAYAYKTRRKRLFYSISIAASVMVILSIGFYQYNFSKPSITEFAESSEGIEIESANDVQLFLSGDKKVAIQNNNSSIAYQTSGREVNIADSLGKRQEIVLDDPNEFNTLIVPYGKRSKIVLSDGTMVWLNSGSKLTYPVTFKGKNREVFLTGEAIFDVSHNAEHPFKVLSKGHTIEVLGTVFNVSNYPDDNNIKTVLKSGSVEISYKSDSFFKSEEKTKITPGTMAVYNKARPQVNTKDVEVENYFSWREGVLIFKNNNLKYIMKKIGRYYNVDVNFQESELENETFSGHLNLKDSIESVLTTLQGATDFKYKVAKNGSLIINKLENME
ncbi:FecR family protein [Salegentibacter holothuriorum]|uniref:FecR family protein n=1 Tax=Salegentibacter holothuriorum TaxID=241145 RepID=A0A1T5E9J6_9FLAO|nr:FecR family protein [Salegentibacter holothuriorum]SKB80470.1 FecR family protein [Salegentibacter holothuriorum]